MLPSAVPVPLPDADGPAVELRELLTEHARISAWLDRLDSLRSDAPSSISGQVRADYLQRLASVTSAVAERANGLRHAAAAAAKRIARARDQLPELRLRHAVGELDDAAVAQRLAVLRREAEEAERERASVTKVLEEADRAIAAASARIPATGTGGDAGASRSVPEMDDAFGEWQGPPSHRASRSAAEESEAHAPADEDDLGFLELLPHSRGPEANSASTAERPTLSTNPPKPAAGSAPNKLVCRSCRFANDAQSWYCEKCGSELG